MRRRQQFAERPPPHNVGLIRRVQPVGRVGLTALELQDDQRSPIAVNIFAHPIVETQLIDPMPLLDRLGARELLVLPDVEVFLHSLGVISLSVLGHDDAPLKFLRERYAATPISICPESLHTSEVQVWQWRDCGPRPGRPPVAWCASTHSPAPARHHRTRRLRRTPGSPGQ